MFVLAAFLLMLTPFSALVAHASAHADTSIPLAIRLRMRNPDELRNLLVRLYTPHDSLYEKYLTPAEFTERFGATQTDFDNVADYFRGIGCTIRFRHANRLLLDADCPQTRIESALGIKITRSLDAAGELIQSINHAPAIPPNLPIEAIHGLSSVPRHAEYIRLNGPFSLSGSGPLGGMSPGDIRNAYGLSASSLDGSGQTLALFELDGFTASDIKGYLQQFGVSAVPTRTVLVDGFNGKPGSGAPEVTLDIELMNAVAPHAKSILVYEGPNTNAGVIDVYQRIADDNAATQISTSWGLPEDQSDSAQLNSENEIFEQMAAQGQSIYAASGDHGAFDDGNHLGVDDPASQPYVTSTGGTTLTMNPDHTYLSETSWWDGRIGGGGGISAVWPLPAWQGGVASTASLGSSTKRNVPDVALNADPSSGYSIYLGGTWQVYGGTSCAAPIWAAFTALVNESRSQSGASALGFPNPAIYRIEKAGNELHDIADGSTNGNYPAVAGYDLSTGWGTLNGTAFLSALAEAPNPSPSPSPAPSPSPTPPPSGMIADPPLIEGSTYFVAHDPYLMIPIEYDVSRFPGARGIYFEISRPGRTLSPPNSSMPDPAHFRFGTNIGAVGRLYILPARDLGLWGDFSIRIIPLDASGTSAVGLFSNSSHLLLTP